MRPWDCSGKQHVLHGPRTAADVPMADAAAAVPEEDFTALANKLDEDDDDEFNSPPDDEVGKERNITVSLGNLAPLEPSRGMASSARGMLDVGVQAQRGLLSRDAQGCDSCAQRPMRALAHGKP